MSVLTPDNVQQVKNNIIDSCSSLVPVFSAEVNTIGGKDRPAIIVKMSFTEKSKWYNNIFLNSLYSIISINSEGEIKQTFRHHKVPKLRNKTVKSVNDIIIYISTYIKQAKNMKMENKQVEKLKRLIQNEIKLVVSEKKKQDLKSLIRLILREEMQAGEFKVRSKNSNNIYTVKKFNPKTQVKIHPAKDNSIIPNLKIHQIEQPDKNLVSTDNWERAYDEIIDSSYTDDELSPSANLDLAQEIGKLVKSGKIKTKSDLDYEITWRMKRRG